jgi:hypothetical protein
VIEALVSRLDEFPDEGRDDVAGLRIKIVARAIEVDGQQGDGIEAVLLAVCLCLDKQHFLGQSVGSIGFLRIAVPEILFFERHGRVFRVRADGAHGHELSDTPQPGLFHEVDPHSGVLVEVPARIPPVRADPADDCGEVNDDLGLLLFEQLSDHVLIAQIAVFATRNNDSSGLVFLEGPPYISAQEPRAPGHQYRPVLQEAHAALLQFVMDSKTTNKRIIDRQ